MAHSGKNSDDEDYADTCFSRRSRLVEISDFDMTKESLFPQTKRPVSGYSCNSWTNISVESGKQRELGDCENFGHEDQVSTSRLEFDANDGNSVNLIPDGSVDVDFNMDFSPSQKNVLEREVADVLHGSNSSRNKVNEGETPVLSSSELKIDTDKFKSIAQDLDNRLNEILDRGCSIVTEYNETRSTLFQTPKLKWKSKTRKPTDCTNKKKQQNVKKQADTKVKSKNPLTSTPVGKSNSKDDWEISEERKKIDASSVARIVYLTDEEKSGDEYDGADVFIPENLLPNCMQKQAMFTEMEKKRGRSRSADLMRPSNIWRKRRWRNYTASDRSQSMKERHARCMLELQRKGMVNYNQDRHHIFI